MPDESGGAPQHHNATETPAGSPDPAMLIAAAGGRHEHHPLFPRADGSTEKRDIQFVSFCRKRTSDQAILTCPEDIPAHEVISWAQVVEWWGGGEYKAVAKDAKHRTVAWFPSATGEWLSLDGDLKPFLVRSENGCSMSGPDVVQPAAPEPAPQDAHLDVMTQVLHELRNVRVTAAPLPPAADSPLVTMIRAQAAQATAASQAHAAQATATNQANAQRMQTLVLAVAQRPAEPATYPAESTTLALQLLSAMKKLVPTRATVPCVAEQVAVIKALRDLDQSTAVAPANQLRPFVDRFGQVMAADAARTKAERAQTATKPQEAPAPHPLPPPWPALVHVPGIGMVEVVAPHADALRFDDMSTEERAAEVRKDPALLRELGLAPAPIAPVAPMVAVAPVAVVQPSPASPASPMSSAVVELMAAITVIPDLEPTPVPVVAATPPAVSSTVPAEPSAVPTEPPVIAAAPPELPAPPAAPSMDAAAPDEPPGTAPDEPLAIALPERMPDPEPLHAAAADHQRAIDAPKRLTLLTHETWVAALRRPPGIDAMADDVARAMASLPADAATAKAQTLDLDSVGALAGTAITHRSRLTERNSHRSHSRARADPKASLKTMPCTWSRATPLTLASAERERARGSRGLRASTFTWRCRARASAKGPRDAVPTACARRSAWSQRPEEEPCDQGSIRQTA
jgi:hypothetical protein